MILGIVVVGSLKTRFPLVRKLLGKMIKLDLVDAAVREGRTRELKGTPRSSKGSSFARLTSSERLFFLSAILNYVLAKIIVVSPAGNDGFQ